MHVLSIAPVVGQFDDILRQRALGADSNGILFYFPPQLLLLVSVPQKLQTQKAYIGPSSTGLVPRYFLRFAKITQFLFGVILEGVDMI